jgi:hypothetical protein
MREAGSRGARERGVSARVERLGACHYSFTSLAGLLARHAVPVAV